MTDWKPPNVLDHLKELSKENIQTYCQTNSIPASVAMMHVNGDFNFSQIVRTANFFGFQEVHYWGRRRWDRRGAVGTQNYTPIHHHQTEEELFDLIERFGWHPIAVENNVPNVVSIYEWEWETMTDPNMKPMFIFGEESNGLPATVLNACKTIIEIPGEGSVRSLNVASTFAILASLYNGVKRHME